MSLAVTTPPIAAPTPLAKRALLHAVAGLGLTYILFGLVLNSVGAVILQSIATLGQNKLSTASLEAFKDLPIAVASFLLASQLPRLGYRRALLIANGLVASACLIILNWPQFTSIRLFFMICGVGFVLAKISVYAAIGLLANKPAQHASLLNLLEALFMFGVLSGFWLFGAFITDQPAGPDWIRVYWILAGLAILAMLLLLGSPITDHDLRKSAKDEKPCSPLSMLRLLGDRLVLIFLLSAFLYVLIEQAINSWLPTFNNEVLHLPARMSVQAASLFAAALMIGRLLASMLLVKLNWFAVMMLCLGMTGTLILITLPLTNGLQPIPGINWRNAPLIVYLMPLIGLAIAPIYPILNSVILTSLPRANHAVMVGLVIVFSALGGSFGSFLTGHMFSHFGGQTAFYLTLIPITCLLSLVILLQLRCKKTNSSDLLER
jgi:MFS transporter, FHS family, glucose/mannose:H+ symporter